MINSTVIVKVETVVISLALKKITILLQKTTCVKYKNIYSIAPTFISKEKCTLR